MPQCSCNIYFLNVIRFKWIPIKGCFQGLSFGSMFHLNISQLSTDEGSASDTTRNPIRGPQ
jgi:hypothetical protein